MPIYAKTKFVFIGLAVLAVYSYGWKVTEINLSNLFRDFHLVKPLVKELVQPDLLSRKKQSQTTETEFFLGENFSRQAPSVNNAQETYLILSPKSGKIMSSPLFHYPELLNVATYSLSVTTGDDMITDGGLDDATAWDEGTNWAFSGGKLVHSAGTAGYVRQTGLTFVEGDTYSITFDIS